ncbi:MAG: cytochrome C oxidase subunit IV family protein [Candidatus Korobacteraceae bacterium]|jgi:cytochrome c oxidase subunit 4
MSEPLTSVKTFVAIWITLLVLTGVTVGVAQLNLGALSVAVALIIAVIKASLVALFFMEIRYSHKMTQVVLIGGVVWLLILLLLSMTDYASRAWTAGI